MYPENGMGYVTRKDGVTLEFGEYKLRKEMGMMKMIFFGLCS